MKKILVAGLIALGLVGCATPITSTQQAMPEVSQVIEIPNKSKDQILKIQRYGLLNHSNPQTMSSNMQTKVLVQLLGKEIFSILVMVL